MQNPTLSLCLIARDEENNIPRCLSSAKDIVDEIIVVDTGSRDNTLRAARSEGARVFTLPWSGNFSEARNYSLNQAKGDWILYLDADEELVPGSEEIIKTLIKDATVEGYYFIIENLLEKGEKINHLNLRLFRHRPEYQFRGLIHEQILPSILNRDPKVRLLKTPVTILHRGYTQKERDSKNKLERNLAILKNAVMQNPRDKFMKYNLGVAYFEGKKHEESLVVFENLVEEVDSNTGYYPSLLRNLIICSVELKKYNKALKYCQKGINLFSDYQELYYLAALIFKENQHYSKALNMLEKCLSMPASPSRYLTTQGVKGFKSYYMLGQVLEELADLNKAANSYILALQDNPKFSPALLSLLEVKKKICEGNEALKQVKEYFEFSTPAALTLLGESLLKVGEYNLALQELRSLRDYSEISTESLVAWGKAALLTGNLKEAESLLNKTPKNSPYYNKSLKELFFLNLTEGDFSKAHETLERLSSIPEGKTSFLAFKTFLGLLETKNAGEEIPKGEIQQEPLLFLAERALALDNEGYLEILATILNKSNHPAFLLIGKLCIKQGKIDNAAHWLLKSLEEKKIDEEMCHFLGDVCQNRGAKEEAITFYKQAMELSPRKAFPIIKLTAIYLQEASTLIKDYSEAEGNFSLTSSFKNIERALEEISLLWQKDEKKEKEGAKDNE